MLASGVVDTALDYEAIDLYLTLGFFPRRRTPLAAVRKLEPGERIVVADGRVDVEAYWEFPEPAPSTAERSEDEWAAELLELLDESVRLRLMSDVPLGAMLSGGLDSSLVVALMARHMAEPVKTFAIGFSDEGADNELDDARFVAEALGTDHHELELSYASDVVDLPELLWHLDEPVADLSALGFHAVSQLASRHVTVALSGQGADELFGGYRKHRAAALVGRLGRTRRPVGAVGAPRRRPASAARPPPSAPVTRWSACSRRAARWTRASARARARPACGRRAGLRRACLARDARRRGGRPAAGDALSRRPPRARGRHGPLLRPRLDGALARGARAVPRPRAGRVLRHRPGGPEDPPGHAEVPPKHAARGLVPDRIIDKPKQGFFRRSSTGWLQAQMPGAVSDYLLGPAPHCAEFLDRGALERLIGDYRAGRNTGRVHVLIAVLLLEIWLATYLPRAAGRPVEPRERIVVGGA